MLDEGLTQEVDRAGKITELISQRFENLVSFCVNTKKDGLLFTCSAFVPQIERCQQRYTLPILKPNEALLEVMLQSDGAIGLLASHPVTLPTLKTQLHALAKLKGVDILVRSRLAKVAWDALQIGE
ncbi:MAG: hypothetical protein CBB68_06145 [Rhodospirillaceae bacterium TMED8]|nr:hypothetical protein [Magnetovibrio sp.]OUT51203.1 MAG: hypothetical protein CBB68_06145 [Rhodospirillaceae bacterium TMED8]